MVAARIRELVGTLPVRDETTGQLRPARYKDVVILLRSLSGWDEIFRKTLEEEGIPVYVTTKTGYFAAQEVQTALNFLKILNNPLQDIPLFGVLHSPVGGFSDAQVALLRADKNAAFAAAAVLLNTLNDLCAIRDALDRGWLAGNRWEIPAERLPARLARLNGWSLGKQVEAAKRYTLNELRAGRHYAVGMRFKLVDATAQDPWAIIEPTALRVVMRRVRQ